MAPPPAKRFGGCRDRVRHDLILDALVASLSDAAPLGFAANDLDLSRSTAVSFARFRGAPTRYLPARLLDFDDTLGAPSRIGSLFRSRRCGQLAAIDEFNANAGGTWPLRAGAGPPKKKRAAPRGRPASLRKGDLLLQVSAIERQKVTKNLHGPALFS